MTDKAKLAEQQARGARAKLLIADPLIAEFFTKMEGEALSAWRESTGPEAELREDAWRMFKAVERLRECFEVTIRTGEHAGKMLLASQSTTRNDK